MEYKCESCGYTFVYDSPLTECPGCGVRRTLYTCHECGALTDDPHTNSDGEDVCEACCDTCDKRGE